MRIGMSWLSARDRSVCPLTNLSNASSWSSSGSDSIAIRRWFSSSYSGRRSAASCNVTLFSRGVLVAFLMYFSMPFRMARAKYAFGYGSLLGSYVRAALVRAR